jgi:hypothetical protein
MIIMVAWLGEDSEVVRPGRPDIGRPAITRPKPKAHAVVWRLDGKTLDVAAARAYAAGLDGGGRVYVYPSDEQEPLARARRERLEGKQGQ